ncbi:unnamed protein product [Arabidopsis lyrata]|nr:unnamed protein product [Arabidopsis lyrata]
MNLDMLGIWCPGSSLTEQFLFPKFPPMWSGLDVEALSSFKNLWRSFLLFDFLCVILMICIAYPSIF